MRDREITVAGLYFEAPGAVPWDDDALVPVPLQLVNIQSDVKNFVAQVDMIQKYQNKENHQIEVVYNFPLEVLKSDPKKLYRKWDKNIETENRVPKINLVSFNLNTFYV